MLDKETVAIPFASGIQPSTRARLLNAGKLLVAENCQLVQDQGPQKRHGHIGRVVRINKPYLDLGGTALPTAAPARETYSTADPQLPATWLYGWGIQDSGISGILPFSTSQQPMVGQVFGAAARDEEVLTWDGHRMFSYSPEQPSLFGETQQGSASAVTRGPCMMPAMRVTPMAKNSGAQLTPDAADNGVLRLIAWVNPGAASVTYSIFDSNNKAALVSEATLAYTAIKSLRCICVGEWFHILVSDSGANSLVVKSFHQESPSVVTSQSYGTVDNQFDVKKIDESHFIAIRLKASVLTATIANADATIVTSWVVDTTGFPPSANTAVACGVDKDGQIGVAWISGVRAFMGVYNQGGGIIAPFGGTAAMTAPSRLTISPRIVGGNSISSNWDLYVEDVVASIPQVKCHSVTLLTGSVGINGSPAIRHRMVLASHAFSVGNRTFAWVAAWLTGAIGLQTTWFLVDASLAPVGKMSYGQANPDLGTSVNVLPSVNWHVDDAAHPYKDRIVYHGALGYNQRVPTSAPGFAPNGVFTEPSINFYELDFLPKLQSGQAGRTTYFAGAQLWAYDGTAVTEAGFHSAPEGVTGEASAGGSLSAGVYRYRVDLCHKNAQNEEVRSWSIVTAGITAAANDKITLTIPVMPFTRRQNSYFLIFRTEAAGTVYRLANSRDPSSANFLLNNLASATFTYVDTLADATLLTREYHPANAAGNYLDPLPAPACEIVAAGRGRLWLAGGELGLGEVAPSRLFSTKDTPAFSPGLNIQVDRNSEPITAIGFFGELAVLFRKTNAYILDSDGPDNSLNGAWSEPRLAIADTGCVAQETLALTSVGLWFQSPAGMRLLGRGGVMDPQAGSDMDLITVTGDYCAAVVVPELTQVRWYSRDASKPTVVLDYSSNAWCTWTGVTCVGAVAWPVTNLAVLARGDGHILEERPGEITDFGSPIQMRVQVAWLHAGQLGDFQRVRRFGLFGKAALGAKLSIKLYYDERPFHDEEFIVQLPDSASGVLGGDQFNASIWGVNEGNWGNLGPWGDGATAHVVLGNELWFRDGIFKIRKRPARQKCSVFSLSISDDGGTAGFEPVVLALELARKTGLDRAPTATNNLA